MSAVKAWHFISYTMSLIWVSDLYMGQIIYIYLTGPGESGKINPVYPAVSTQKTGSHRTGAQPCPSAACQFGLTSLTEGTYGGELGLSWFCQIHYLMHHFQGKQTGSLRKGPRNSERSETPLLKHTARVVCHGAETETSLKIFRIAFNLRVSVLQQQTHDLRGNEEGISELFHLTWESASEATT